MTQLPDGSGCFTATILSNEEALALPLKERPISHRISSEMYHAVFEHIGEASMAWSPNTGSAVFNTEMASDVAVRLCFKIANELEKLTQELKDEIWNLKLELKGSQSYLEKALADQRRNLCAESDALIEKLKQAREWVNLSATEVCSMNKSCAEYIAQMEKQIADGAKMLGMATDLNLGLQNQADMWRDEFERIKAICYGKSLEFLEIQGICERAMLDIRSKISLIDQREKVAEENINLRRELRVISDHYDTLRAELVENNAKIMHGMFQAAAMSKDMDYCRTMSNAKLRAKCLVCDGKGEVGGQFPDGSYQTDACPHCEGNGFVEIPDLAWLNQGKIQFNLLPKDHPDYDPTLE